MQHDYHLLPRSSYPILMGLMLFLTALGSVAFFHDYNFTLILPGFMGALCVVFLWVKSVIQESWMHTPVVTFHMRYGFALFIISELMFFVAWFWSYFDIALFPSYEGLPERASLFSGMFPPKGLMTVPPWEIPFVNTLILLLSGTTLTKAHHHLIKGDKESMIPWFALTIILGFLFLGLQGYEYMHARFSMDENVYGSVFYMATGFHGFHVLMGLIFLFVCFFGLTRRSWYSPKDHFSFEAATWYWHFVDVVWLFLFLFVYVWGS